MRFYSTNSKNTFVSFEEAVRSGLAPDGGLFMPEKISRLPQKFWDELPGKSFKELAFDVAYNFLNDSIPESALREIIDQVISFDAPLVKVEARIYSLELFHGPTMAFKDFGARFLSALMSYYSKSSGKETTILVATSGDTGSAVANGFLGVKGTRVIVLYPSGKVSEVQEKQFTTLGRNITAIEIDGTFDDCQRLVKQAFSDPMLSKRLSLTSANSINIARLLPQSFYYFHAYAQLKTSESIVISVPSGNFGNLMAGLMAKQMGLPVKKFIASTNVNDVVPEFLKTAIFKPRHSVQTISNAMDVGNPSNFARMVDHYNNDFARFSEDVTGYSFTDKETADAIRRIFIDKKYLMDPHGAVGYLGLKKYVSDHKKEAGVFLETAHPGKFKEVVEEAIGQSIDLPEGLLKFMKGNKKSVLLSNSFEEFKSFLLN